MHTQATGEPLMLISFIASGNPQHAQQGVNSAVYSGALQEQLQGIGLSLVPGSANVVRCSPVPLTALQKHHTRQNVHPQIQSLPQSEANCMAMWAHQGVNYAVAGGPPQQQLQRLDPEPCARQCQVKCYFGNFHGLLVTIISVRMPDVRVCLIARI